MMMSWSMQVPQAWVLPQSSLPEFTERQYKSRRDKFQCTYLTFLLCSSSNTVTATASTKEKLDWLLSLENGATHAVNYKTQDFAAEVKKTTHNKGVDVIIDFVGKSHWKQNIDALAPDGRMTVLAVLSGK